jgi:hypothetical protein
MAINGILVTLPLRNEAVSGTWIASAGKDSTAGRRHEPDPPLPKTLNAAILASGTMGSQGMSTKTADLRRR